MTSGAMGSGAGGVRDATPACREVDMDWWWIPVGLAAWLAVSVAVALWLGSALRRCSQAREARDQATAMILALPKRPPWYPGVVR